MAEKVRVIPFKRITYGTIPDGMSLRGRDIFWKATIIRNVLIPDYDLEFCNRDELEMRYDWKLIAMASFIKKHTTRTGDYVLDLQAKTIKEKPPAL